MCALRSDLQEVQWMRSSHPINHRLAQRNGISLIAPIYFRLAIISGPVLKFVTLNDSSPSIISMIKAWVDVPTVKSDGKMRVL